MTVFEIICAVASFVFVVLLWTRRIYVKFEPRDLWIGIYVKTLVP